MDTIEEHELEENEKKELRKMIKEAQAMYEFMREDGLTPEWMGDSERFMGFTFIHTKTLVKHSNALTKLTRWLIGLTIGLLVLTLGNIFFILNNTYRWL